MKSIAMNSCILMITVHFESLLRSSIWDDTLRAIKRTFDEKHVRVTFLGESAVDGRGPRREFFMLLMNAVRENNSLDGQLTTHVLRHNTTALQNELYLCMGKMIALSIVHGGPGPSFSAGCVVDYLFNALGSVSTTIAILLTDRLH